MGYELALRTHCREHEAKRTYVRGTNRDDFGNLARVFGYCPLLTTNQLFDA
ncbi:hypothetical protein TC41_2470 [Alicyclobacillus acidocaldarius subsp. acidocaldarius Tc-4-1]|uniref:Uncharacterized protein n=1 Tax=Alicyclobacillus acidocaldarius (strain Tc-4-1) TaxID=1048834 RepID=F8IH15_ALIAT|nr:hypothetical protein TC41_2470 [Alicyclobacillus acidocaldarius subsp. acidocaldarius Tc-4-1]